MATLTESINGWHPGERAIHTLLHVPTTSRPNPTNSGLPPHYHHRIVAAPLLAVGAVDPTDDSLWTTLWGGERGTARPVAPNTLGLHSLVDKAHDPVLRAFLASSPSPPDTEVHQFAADNQPAFSALAIDLSTRDRVKLAGSLLVAAVTAVTDRENNNIAKLQMGLGITESLGNCPKYLNKKDLIAHVPTMPELLSDKLPLSNEAVDLIGKADMFFMSTAANGRQMDTNHRGGPRGFIRVERNGSDEGVSLVYPEYSGNRLYQSLGNLHVDPRVGVAIPDFTSSSILYLSGTAEILAGKEAERVLARTKLAVRIHVSRAVLIRDGMPVREGRGDLAEASPYNPPVRKLVSERQVGLVSGGIEGEKRGGLTATLTGRTILTPTVSRVTFRLSMMPGQMWTAGGYVTLDFSEELSGGWAHMNDGDPQSLNDDFVRTFTVSSAPWTKGSSKGGAAEVELTVRRHGPVTRLLATHPLNGGPLEVPVRGFGATGGFTIRGGGEEKKAVFVAGGVGVTPLLAQVQAETGDGLLSLSKLELLWSLRGEDLGLAVDSFERVDGLAAVTKVFVTGSGGEEGKVARLREMGARVEARRLEKGDVLGMEDVAGRGTRYLLCAGPGLSRVVQGWLDGKEVVSESFEY